MNVRLAADETEDRYWEVPRIREGGAVFIVGGGPSLRGFDFQRLRDFDVLAVNNSFLVCPWAIAVCAADEKWLVWHKEELARYEGLVITLYPGAHKISPRFKILRHNGSEGLEVERRDTVKTGNNSAYQAINVAVHMGFDRLYLLGIDMQLGPELETHWHRGHPRQTDSHVFEKMWPLFRTAKKPLKRAGVRCWNCSPRSRVDAFEFLSVDEALEIERDQL